MCYSYPPLCNVCYNIQTLREGLYKFKQEPYKNFLEQKKEKFNKLTNDNMNETKENLFVTGISAISTNPIRTCNPEAYRNKNCINFKDD
jgi:hypothetical protein